MPCRIAPASLAAPRHAMLVAFLDRVRGGGVGWPLAPRALGCLAPRRSVFLFVLRDYEEQGEDGRLVSPRPRLVCADAVYVNHAEFTLVRLDSHHNIIQNFDDFPASFPILLQCWRDAHAALGVVEPDSPTSKWVRRAFRSYRCFMILAASWRFSAANRWISRS